MKQTTIKYRVAPMGGRSGHFPIDMLRYDGAYPADEQQSAWIIDTFWYMSATGGDSGRPPPQPIEVVATFNASPNNDRWKSFGWHVTHVWTGYEWENYIGAHRAHRLVK
jgi:hypothetical protein